MSNNGQRAAVAGSAAGRVPGRRTFAIISHPDAGKTTLTEKFLLYSGAIKTAGAVKSRKQERVRSDWMELERQRGISITSAVLGLDYRGRRLNLLDTPGHADFSEDTYRTLYAVDSALMVLDAARGIESRTLKLFEVCREQSIPIITFVNKLDRPALEPLELLDQIESSLGLKPVPVTWPVGDAGDFRGVVDRRDGTLVRYNRTAHGAAVGSEETVPLSEVGEAEELLEELALLEAVGSGAGEDFDRESFLAGDLTPVFFGSALANFGVRLLLDSFVELAPAPVPRRDAAGRIRDLDEPFSGFVFKVQANMDPKHRDRIAFVRVCSGRFERGMRLVCERTGRVVATRHAQQLFADDRETVEEAYPGDVVGLVNTQGLNVGDTLFAEGATASPFPRIPDFVPEHFALARNGDSGKHKQFWKGLGQLSEEGVVTVLRRPEDGGQEPILGAVGPLQFQVAEHRMEHEFGAPLRLRSAPWTEALRLTSEKEALRLSEVRGTRIVRDGRGRPLALFEDRYWLRQALGRIDN
ncbi:peptide chain release factor 3 [Rubrobacter radiotolerans]|uniref:Peptide chain release factor 3 n=1 Tax=Rubrobacter radiotolerans TaxID=42256 RepID=A0AB35T6X2_RUBRA|nr:peptide chain release factor 3 [Rubrobacter radiotolerans]MDX5895213.1 peptide chain release factor 3 [Rubrobacter radiotolerans]SMC07660.1 peptide chain release factor 3 [Rubrobacter radiotolerans DSM 5868]